MRFVEKRALQAGLAAQPHLSAGLHWSSQVVLTLAGLSVGSLGLRFPLCPPNPRSVEGLAIKVDVVQVGQEITEWTTVW